MFIIDIFLKNGSFQNSILLGNPESLAKPVAEYIMTRTHAISDKTQDIKNPKTYGLDAFRRTLKMPKTPDMITSVPAHIPDAVSPYDAFK